MASSVWAVAVFLASVRALLKTVKQLAATVTK